MADGVVIFGLWHFMLWLMALLWLTEICYGSCGLLWFMAGVMLLLWFMSLLCVGGLCYGLWLYFLAVGVIMAYGVIYGWRYVTAYGVVVMAYDTFLLLMALCYGLWRYIMAYGVILWRMALCV